MNPQPSANTMIRSARMLLGAMLLAGTSIVMAAAPFNTLKRGVFSDSDTGIAINGYDTVAYFTNAKAVPGSDAHTMSWNGAIWKFASKEHLDLFKAQPERYAPQYGGYCAYGVSKGYLVSIEPEQFTVLNNKLYLNYDAGVQKKWSQDPAGYNKIADAKISSLIKP